MTTNRFETNYIKCPKCDNTLDMSFVNKSCPNPLCSFNFNGLDELLNKDDQALRNALLVAYRDKESDELDLITTAIKYNIGNYLAHFIECNWGAHYHALYKDFILLYLEDLNILKKVLTSDIIKEKDNMIKSKNGYKMFWNLYKYLIKVNNVKIREFLRKEFPEYWQEWYKGLRIHKI